MKRKMTVRLEPLLIGRLDKVAQAADISRSELVRAILAGSALRDIQGNRRDMRELLHALNGILGHIQQIAQYTDRRKWPDISILEGLHEIKLALLRIHQAVTGGRDDP